MYRSVCCLGKGLTKGCVHDSEQVRHLFSVLGTPKVVGYTDFDRLPLASKYGDLVRDESGQYVAARCSLAKILNQRVHKHVQDTFVFDSRRSSTTWKGSSCSHDSPSYGSAAVQAIYHALQLNPTSRCSFKDLLRHEFFVKECPLVVSLGSGGAYHTTSRSEFERLRMENVVPLIRYVYWSLY